VGGGSRPPLPGLGEGTSIVLARESGRAEIGMLVFGVWEGDASLCGGGGRFVGFGCLWAAPARQCE
jgi:hypothetical protein